VKHPTIHEHLTRYTSKKKKSELNASCEMFAKEIYEKEGPGTVRVKVEVDVDSSDEEAKDETVSWTVMGLSLYCK